MAAKEKSPEDDWFRIDSLTEIEVEEPKDDPEVIKGLLQVRDAGNIIASSKLGKSYFVCQLICSYVTDTPWLGFQFGPATRRVLLIDNELKRRQIWWRLRRIATALGVEFAEVKNNVDIVSLRGQRRSIQDIQKKLASFSPGTYGLIVLDSNYRAHGNESDPAEMADFYDTMINIAHRANAAMLGVHHSTKGSQAEKAVTDVGSGSGVIARAVDVHIIMRTHETADCVTMDFALRNYKRPKPLVLRNEYPLWVHDSTLDPKKLLNNRSAPKPTFAHIQQIMGDSAHPEFHQMDWKHLRDNLALAVGCGSRTAADFIRSMVEAGELIKIPGKNKGYSVTLPASEIAE